MCDILLPPTVKCFISEAQANPDMKLSFKIFDNFNTKTLVLKFTDMNSFMHSWKPRRKYKSPSEIARDMRRKENYLASRAEHSTFTQTEGHGTLSLSSTAQPSIPQTCAEQTHTHNTGLVTVSPVIQTSEPPAVQLSVPRDVPATHGRGKPEKSSAAASGVKDTSKGLTKKDTASAARKNSLRSSSKDKRYRVTFSKDPTVDNKHVSCYNDETGQWHFYFCTNCLGCKDTGEVLLRLKKQFGLKVEGESFTWYCFDCDRNVTYKDPDILKKLR